jgi:hypothetical protein
LSEACQATLRLIGDVWQSAEVVTLVKLLLKDLDRC